jgi:hypothetical protein
LNTALNNAGIAGNAVIEREQLPARIVLVLVLVVVLESW